MGRPDRIIRGRLIVPLSKHLRKHARDLGAHTEHGERLLKAADSAKARKLIEEAIEKKVGEATSELLRASSADKPVMLWLWQEREMILQMTLTIMLA